MSYAVVYTYCISNGILLQDSHSSYKFGKKKNIGISETIWGKLEFYWRKISYFSLCKSSYFIIYITYIYKIYIYYTYISHIIYIMLYYVNILHIIYIPYICIYIYIYIYIYITNRDLDGRYMYYIYIYTYIIIHQIDLFNNIERQSCQFLSYAVNNMLYILYIYIHIYIIT